jgi:hypothetical protein
LWLKYIQIFHVRVCPTTRHISLIFQLDYCKQHFLVRYFCNSNFLLVRLLKLYVWNQFLIYFSGTHVSNKKWINSMLLYEFVVHYDHCERGHMKWEPSYARVTYFHNISLQSNIYAHLFWVKCSVFVQSPWKRYKYIFAYGLVDEKKKQKN